MNQCSCITFKSILKKLSQGLRIVRNIVHMLLGIISVLFLFSSRGIQAKLREAKLNYVSQTIDKQVSTTALWTDQLITNIFQGRIQGEGAGGAHPPSPEMTCGFLIQLVFCKKLCGLLVLKQSKRRVHPLLKKILGPPLFLVMHDEFDRVFSCYTF